MNPWRRLGTAASARDHPVDSRVADSGRHPGSVASEAEPVFADLISRIATTHDHGTKTRSPPDISSDCPHRRPSSRQPRQGGRDRRACTRARRRVLPVAEGPPDPEGAETTHTSRSTSGQQRARSGHPLSWSSPMNVMAGDALAARRAEAAYLAKVTTPSLARYKIAAVARFSTTRVKSVGSKRRSLCSRAGRYYPGFRELRAPLPGGLCGEALVVVTSVWRASTPARRGKLPSCPRTTSARVGRRPWPRDRLPISLG